MREARCIQLGLEKPEIIPAEYLAERKDWKRDYVEFQHPSKHLVKEVRHLVGNSAMCLKEKSEFAVTGGAGIVQSGFPCAQWTGKCIGRHK